MRVIHVQTQITTVFGVIDDAGDVQKVPVQATVDSLSDETWMQAAGQLRGQREQMEKDLAAQAREASAAKPNRAQRRAKKPTAT